MIISVCHYKKSNSVQIHMRRYEDCKTKQKKEGILNPIIGFSIKDNSLSWNWADNTN